MDNQNCYHCGDPCDDGTIQLNEKVFCCHGCKTVYEIFESNDLSYYYELQAAAGHSPLEQTSKYDFLENAAIAERLLEFDDGTHQLVNLYIPTIHCFFI